MPKILFNVSDNTGLDDLYRMFEVATELVEETSWLWAYRSHAPMRDAINTFQKFLRGEVDTDGPKRHFKQLTKLAEEVVMTASQSAAVLAMAEIAHAGAHLGHLATAMSRGDRTEADKEYVKLQRAYVMFGLRGVERFVKLALDEENRRQFAAEAA